MQHNADIILDCAYMLCPLPMLKLQQQWRNMPHNHIICCITTDPKAPEDIKNFINQQQALLLNHHKEDNKDYITIKK